MADEYDDFAVGYNGPSTGADGAIRVIDHLLSLIDKPEPEDTNGAR